MMLDKYILIPKNAIPKLISSAGTALGLAFNLCSLCGITMYKMPKECMGFQIEEYGKCVGMPTYKTQSFDHEGHSFSLSLILDTKMVLHAYDDNVWYNKENKFPVEIAVLIDGKFFEDTDVTVELVGSDLELGIAMHKVLEELLTILNS